MAVVIETTLGDITVDLYLEQRPVTCLNFLKLCKMKYYNFNLFHTIRSGFIAQTGDPSGEGSGGQSIFALLEGPGKRFFSGEKMPKIRHSDTGLLSMVGTGDVMIGSQFFFTLGPDLDSLDGYHCVIGEVTEGHDVLRKLNDVICDETHRPYQDVRITHTVVLEDPFNDPTGLWAPTRSPSPSAERLKGGRIAPDEELDEAQGKTAAEIQEMIEEKEAKARATILEIVGDIPDADIAPPENVLFVCKLNPVTTDDDLEIIFSRFGKINSCEVIRDKKTGDSLQYAFIEFDNKKSCEDAYFKMDNVLIDDRRIHVDFSQSVSKIKWLGKGRGVKHINDDESNGPQDNYVNKDKMRRPRSRDRNEERNHKKDHHEKDKERPNDSRTYSRDRRERGHSRDRKSRDRRESKHHKDRRDRSKSNSRRHREDKHVRNKKEHKDRSRSRSKEVRSKDRTSKHEANHSNHDGSHKSERHGDDNRKKHEEKKDKNDHSGTHKSKSKKSPYRNERSVSNKSPSTDRNKEKPDKKSEKRESYHNSKHNSTSHERDYRSEKEQESKNRNVENQQLKRKNATIEEQEINKKNSKHERKNPEPRTPSPAEKIKNMEKNLSREDNKDKKTKKNTNKVIKKKRKPSTSSDSDSSESSSSSSDSTSSSDSDRKKKRARRKKRQSTSSSSSTSDSSSTSSSSSDSTSSSESEPTEKKRKINKKKGEKKDKKKS